MSGTQKFSQEKIPKSYLFLKKYCQIIFKACPQDDHRLATPLTLRDWALVVVLLPEKKKDSDPSARSGKSVYAPERAQKGT